LLKLSAKTSFGGPTMNTILFYVILCTSPVECNTFTPMTWEVASANTASNAQERKEAFMECSILSKAYDQLKAVKETECWFEE
jgi:hypothetical protein